jgi:hypothetical protein
MQTKIAGHGRGFLSRTTIYDELVLLDFAS